MNQETLIKDLRALRLRLNPVLSDHYKEILLEAEKRLSGEDVSSALNLSKKINRRLTKAELREKFSQL